MTDDAKAGGGAGDREAPAQAGARARGKEAATPKETRRRVYRIAELMAAGEWSPDLEPQLAAEWELAPGTIRKMTAEASRLLEYTTEDRQKLINLTRLRLQRILEDDDNDRVAAARTLLEHLGELRQFHMVRRQIDKFEGWTDQEIATFVETGVRPERLVEP